MSTFMNFSANNFSFSESPCSFLSACPLAKWPEVNALVVTMLNASLSTCWVFTIAERLHFLFPHSHTRVNGGALKSYFVNGFVNLHLLSFSLSLSLSLIFSLSSILIWLPQWSVLLHVTCRCFACSHWRSCSHYRARGGESNSIVMSRRVRGKTLLFQVIRSLLFSLHECID